MKRSAEILALGLTVVLGTFCGKKGPLQPPLAKEPKAVERLNAYQRGGSIILEWANPGTYVDGRKLGAGATAELWLLDPGAEASKPAASQDFASRARAVRRLAAAELKPSHTESSGGASGVTFAYTLPSGKVGPRALAVSVRILDAKKRPSHLSPPITVEIRPCPLPPEIRDITVFADRLRIDWAPPAADIDGSSPAHVGGYAVYRSSGDAPPEKLTPSPASGLSFEDRQFRFGVAYRYVVRACAAGAGPDLESDDSAAREIVPKDIFPPAPPSGLVAVPGPDVVSLAWDASREEDVAGYRVWRKDEDGADFVCLTPALVPGNAFTDTQVQKDRAYRYAVSAADKNGNEGPKSETGPVSLKGRRP